MAGSHSIPQAVGVTDAAQAVSAAIASKEVHKNPLGGDSRSYCPAAAVSPAGVRNGTMPGSPAKVRHCTMGYIHPYVKPNYAYPTAARRGPEPRRVPFLRLQGRWLHQAQFAIGTPVRVLVKPGRIVLEVDDADSASFGTEP